MFMHPASDHFTPLSPFITKAGKPWVSFGVMGGGAQPQMHAQIVINLVDFGMNLQEASDAPRILYSGSSQPTGEMMVDGGYVSLENGFHFSNPQRLIKGHVLREVSGWFGAIKRLCVIQ